MRRPHRHHTRPLHRARGLRERGQTIDHGARRRHGRHMLRLAKRHQGLHRHIIRHTAGRLRHHGRHLRQKRSHMRLEPCERRGQGTTMKIRIQDGAIYIAPEDDEER
nr:MAG TPA: hypothetical protein [Caudoviricetes sp.]